MSVEVSRPASEDGERRDAEIDVRIAEVRRELAELFALRREEAIASSRLKWSTESQIDDGKDPDSQPLQRRSQLRRWLHTGRLALRHLLRSPASVFADVERFFARRQHQHGQWTAAAGRVAVEDRLQYVWPLNVEVRPGLAPTLNVLLPSLRKQDLTGGPNTALNLTFRLAARGVPVRYIATDQELDADDNYLRAHLRSVSGMDAPVENVEFRSGRDRGRPLVLGSDDVLCGTAWWTVQMIKEIQPQLHSRRFFYLIQDYEPAMYAWSTRQALALETYSLDYYGIICGRLLADFLAKEHVGRFAEPGFSDQCVTFEPAVDPRRFFPRFEEQAARKKRLLFYARPQAPRNLFEMGLVALKLAVAQGAFSPTEWEIDFIGGDGPAADLGCGVVIKPIAWCDYDAYPRLLQTADVGLSLMLSPHTSYPPLEMAACGATVVTNTFAVKTAERLRRISPNLLPVEPRVEDIAAGLCAAAARADQLPERFAGTVLDVPQDWNAAFDPVVPRLLEMWNACRGR